MGERDLLLSELTGATGAWWVDFIQKLIPLYCTPTDDPAHPACDPSAWLCDVSREIWKRIQVYQDLTQVDENIVSATAMSLITTLWYARLRRAKAYDARRPIDRRQGAMRKLLRSQLALVECLLDESEDHELFPLPEWDAPYCPNAKDGDFV